MACHRQVSWSSLGVLAGMPRLTSLNCAGMRFSSPTDGEPQEPAPGLDRLLQQLESLTIGDGMALVRGRGPTLDQVGDPRGSELDVKHAYNARTPLNVQCLLTTTSLGMPGPITPPRLHPAPHPCPLFPCLQCFITDGLLSSVVAANPQRLTHLDLSGCIDITDAGGAGALGLQQEAGRRFRANERGRGPRGNRISICTAA